MLHKLDGGRGGVDRPVKALLHQPRDPAGVVEMRVGQDDGIDGVRGYRQVLPVALAPFLLALKETTIDQHLQRTRALPSPSTWMRCFDPVTTPAAPRN